jgi:hypothetical protein
MRIATEILSRRRNQFSSVERFIAALEWERATHEHTLLRRYTVRTADMVLLNVSRSCWRRTERTDDDSCNPSLPAIFA